MATPLHDRASLGLRRPRSVSRLADPEGVTAHYGGKSPWGTGPDRSSAARFQATADHDRCATIWRGWQAFHMDGRGWSDIAYSSGVCPHGHRFEGRGPGVRTAANGTTAGNSRSLAVVYIAGDDDPVTDAAKRAFLDEGRRLGRLYRDHSDWKSTACAGEPVREWEATGWRPPAGTNTGGDDDMSEQAEKDIAYLKREMDKVKPAVGDTRARVTAIQDLAVATAEQVGTIAKGVQYLVGENAKVKPAVGRVELDVDEVLEQLDGVGDLLAEALSRLPEVDDEPVDGDTPATG